MFAGAMRPVWGFGGGTEGSFRVVKDCVAILRVVIAVQGFGGFTPKCYNVRMIRIIATINDGEAESQALDMSGLVIVAMVIPATYDGGSIGFKGSTSLDGTYQTVYTSEGLVKELVTADGYFLVNPQDLIGLEFMKLWSQDGESDAAVGADTDIVLLCRSFA